MQRLRVLIGSRSSLSWQVIVVFGVIGFLSTQLLIRVTLNETSTRVFVVSVSPMLVSCVFLILVRIFADRRGWAQPRVPLVLGSLVAANVLRSLLNAVLVSVLGSGAPVGSFANNRISGPVTTLTTSVGIALLIGASVQLAKERGLAIATLLSEQTRLRDLAESMDADLKQTEIELRNKANELLEPTIAEIRKLLQDEISPHEAAQVSARITEVVAEVVRPASRELATSPIFALVELKPQKPARLHPFADRMDVARAIRPGWILLIGFALLLPGPLILGTKWNVIGIWFAASLVFVALLYVLKFLWPRSLRVMPVGVGLLVLLAIYTLFNVGLQNLFASNESAISGTATWSNVTQIGLVIRIGSAMLISVLAMLDEHGEQNRASLAELNQQLEELIARLRRETWGLHRSISLAIHGPVQSVLVSTAMRLSAANRSEDSIKDARKRLDQALDAIAHDQHETVSIEGALDDLRGLWQSVVRITYDVEPDAHERLASDAGLRRCVIEICRESTSNAIRHGKASSVAMEISVEGDALQVRVVDTGRGISTDPIAGLGMAMLDDTCLNWTLVNRPAGGAELTTLVV